MMRIRFNAAARARLSANLAPNFGFLRRPLRMLPVAALSFAGVATALSVAGAMAALGYAFYAEVRSRRRLAAERHADGGEVLERLTYLHDSGNLSDDEYTRQREKILAAS